MRRLLGPLAVCLALVRTTFAAGEIEGPDAVPLHSLATVSTSVQADGLLWLVFPIETSSPAIQADPKTFQFAGEPGPHVVILVTLKGGQPAGQYRKTVTFGGSPNPTPVPPNPTPNPTPPTSDLATYVRNVVSQAVRPDDRKAGATSIAAAYREAARLGRDGKFATPQVMVTYVKEAMKAARPASWSGFVLEPKFSEMSKAGRLATTADLARAFEEIAVTLEAIADGR